MFQLNLRRRGISDQAVLRAMEEVPREMFVEAADRADAYRDSALGIACGQTISQPFVVAYMTEQLQLQKSHRVLEIGTGSGYQAAILSRLCKQVLTIERYRTLADSARKRLEKLGYYNIEVLLGDGFDVPAGAGRSRVEGPHRIRVRSQVFVDQRRALGEGLEHVGDDRQFGVVDGHQLGGAGDGFTVRHAERQTIGVHLNHDCSSNFFTRSM